MNPQADIVKKSCLKLKVTRSKSGSPSAVQGVSAGTGELCARVPRWVLRSVLLPTAWTRVDILICRKYTVVGGVCA